MYQKITKDEISRIPPDLKLTVLGSLENFGVETHKKKRYWTRKDPIELIDEINAAILDCIDTKTAFDGTDLSEKEIDSHRQLRIVFYHVRRVVKLLIKEEGEEGY